jgi:hypothetical protein
MTGRSNLEVPISYRLRSNEQSLMLFLGSSSGQGLISMLDTLGGILQLATGNLRLSEAWKHLQQGALLPVSTM